MTRKIENSISAALIALMALLPLVFKFVQGVTPARIPDSDVAILHFVFLFACLAGFVTWRRGRHLSLASFSEKLPQKARVPVELAKSAVVCCVLSALLFDSLCQLFNPIEFNSKFWGMSLKIFYAFLPLCYLGMTALAFASETRARGAAGAAVCSCGIILGALVSAGTIAGIFYYVFGAEEIPFLNALNDGWIAFSARAKIPLIILLVVSAFLGVPLFLALAGVAYILLSQGGGYVDVIPLETYRILTDRNTAAIPLFTIAGYVLAQGSAGSRFVNLFKSLFGTFRGGAVVAAVLVTTFFSTFTGVSGVTILALGPLLSVVLTGSGYSKDSAESLVTASGAIGLLLPPSAAIIMYATVNYFSVDVFDLFKGAVIPGVIMMLSMIALGVVFDRQKERPKFSWRELLGAAAKCVPELLMPILICVFYFKGAFDLFETAAFAVVYAVALSTFVRRDFNFSKSVEVIGDSVPVSGGVIFILGAATGISYFMLDANVPALFAEFTSRFITSKYVFLMLMNIVLLFVGCLMDMFSAILIVSPLLLPLADTFGVSAVQAAVIFLMNLSIGFLTPPVGMDLFISSYTFNKPMGRVTRGILPFLAVQFAVLMLITYVPWFTGALL